jgi:hypothetical protein
MPPSVANKGVVALRMDESAPPGKSASQISFVAIAKKKHIKISFTTKWSVSP